MLIGAPNKCQHSHVSESDKVGTHRDKSIGMKNAILDAQDFESAAKVIEKFLPLPYEHKVANIYVLLYASIYETGRRFS